MAYKGQESQPKDKLSDKIYRDNSEMIMSVIKYPICHYQNGLISERRQLSPHSHTTRYAGLSRHYSHRNG